MGEKDFEFNSLLSLGEDAAGEFNIWKYRQFWETFEAPQPPTLGEHELKVPQN